SVAALNRFLGVFDTGDQATRAREELARQQKLLADPAYQARVRGLAQVDKGGSRAAIPELQKALAATPNDAEVLGALGQAYSRAGDRPQALKLFRQALAADKNGYGSGKWQSLIKSTGYWLAIDEGDKALKAGNLALARQKYQQARQLDDSNGDAFIGLGDVAVASKDDAAAEGFYQQALRRDPGNGSALRGLVNIYQRQSPEKALAYLDGLPRSQQAKLRSTLDGLRLDRLKQQAETLAQQQQWQQAAEIYRRAQPLAPDDVWLTYRYAQALRQAGQPQQADALFRQLAQRQHANPQLTYAYALYLSGSDRDRQALAQLNTLPAAQWNDNMRELAQRLKMQATIAHAEGLRAAG
ncbi:tetratricopeptide repeat protein, partial [Serratia nevei]